MANTKDLLKTFSLNMLYRFGPMLLIFLMIVLFSVILGAADPGGQPFIPDNSTGGGSG